MLKYDLRRIVKLAGDTLRWAARRTRFALSSIGRGSIKSPLVEGRVGREVRSVFRRNFLVVTAVHPGCARGREPLVR